MTWLANGAEESFANTSTDNEHEKTDCRCGGRRKRDIPDVRIGGNGGVGGRRRRERRRRNQVGERLQAAGADAFARLFVKNVKDRGLEVAALFS